MKQLHSKILTFALALLMAIRPALAEGGGRDCGPYGNCGETFLNIVAHQGNANVSVGQSCAGTWQHTWQRNDARQTIRQWLNRSAASGSGSLCIPLHPDVNEVRITSAGGHCGFDEDDLLTFANAPGSGGILRFGFGGSSSIDLAGCHAGIGNHELGRVKYGGIVLDFADGYGFGDSYATGFFYGVYDGFKSGGVRPFGASVYALSEFHTYHYSIEILANGRGDWRWGYQDERSGR